MPARRRHGVGETPERLDAEPVRLAMDVAAGERDRAGGVDRSRRSRIAKSSTRRITEIARRRVPVTSPRAAIAVSTDSMSAGVIAATGTRPLWTSWRTGSFFIGARGGQ